MHVVNTKYKNQFQDNLFPALGLPQQCTGERLGYIGYIELHRDTDMTLFMDAKFGPDHCRPISKIAISDDRTVFEIIKIRCI